jgi:hypothetical protein
MYGTSLQHTCMSECLPWLWLLRQDSTLACNTYSVPHIHLLTHICTVLSVVVTCLHNIVAGLYVLNFSAVGETAPAVPAVQVKVHVVNCTQGDVTLSTGDACAKCARGQYSFDPRNSTCDQCVPDAECPGGAVVLALPGFWLSSPHSVQVHR